MYIVCVSGCTLPGNGGIWHHPGAFRDSTLSQSASAVPCCRISSTCLARTRACILHELVWDRLAQKHWSECFACNWRALWPAHEHVNWRIFYVGGLIAPASMQCLNHEKYTVLPPEDLRHCSCVCLRVHINMQFSSSMTPSIIGCVADSYVTFMWDMQEYEMGVTWVGWTVGNKYASSSATGVIMETKHRACTSATLVFRNWNPARSAIQHLVSPSDTKGCQHFWVCKGF